ncbi:MAG: GGDEF domain-containing protein [Nitrospirae bacterium]|nr:GGDEF domain-containing protein [Nitrospirota bacterium]
MRPVFRQSTFMMAISVISFIIILVNGIFVFYSIDRIQHDAKIINYAGLIRGSIQRISKLEMASQKNDDIIRDIDIIFSDFINRKEDFKLKGMEKHFVEGLTKLDITLNELKKNIQSYRTNPHADARRTILELSELCWRSANGLVFEAQAASEEKMILFRSIFVVIGVNLLAVAVIIWLIRNYVKNKLEFLATYDALTGILNRHSYNMLMDREIKRRSRYNFPISLIVFDIDNFKRVNDSLGHKAGDSVLKTITEISTAQTRGIDHFCRIGGEEFAVIASETDLTNAKELADRLKMTVEKHDFGMAGKVTISLGIAEYRADETPDSLFKRADNALGRAKEAGKNKVEINP